jgi:hypothetical protein
MFQCLPNVMETKKKTPTFFHLTWVRIFFFLGGGEAKIESGHTFNIFIYPSLSRNVHSNIGRFSPTLGNGVCSIIRIWNFSWFILQLFMHVNYYLLNLAAPKMEDVGFGMASKATKLCNLSVCFSCQIKLGCQKPHHGYVLEKIFTRPSKGRPL